MPKATVMLALTDEQLTVITAGLNLALGLSFEPPSIASRLEQQVICTDLLVTFRKTLKTYPDVDHAWLGSFLVEQVEVLGEVDELNQHIVTENLRNNPNLS